MTPTVTECEYDGDGVYMVDLVDCYGNILDPVNNPFYVINAKIDGVVYDTVSGSATIIDTTPPSASVVIPQGQEYNTSSPDNDPFTFTVNYSNVPEGGVIDTQVTIAGVGENVYTGSFNTQGLISIPTTTIFTDYDPTLHIGTTLSVDIVCFVDNEGVGGSSGEYQIV